MKDSFDYIILIGAYLDTLALSSIGVRKWQSRRATVRAASGRRLVARLGVRLDFQRWAGSYVSPSKRRAFARAVERLERIGYAIRRGRRRTTHIKLTASGNSFARALLATPDDAPMTYITLDDLCEPSANSDSLEGFIQP